MIPSLCFVTDADASRPVVDQAVAAAKGGAGWVQLRDKSLSDADFADLARILIAALADHGARLVVNDRVEVAIAVNAPVLHIGQQDGDPRAIRARIGPDVVLGLSVCNAEELAHVPEGVDYLGIGPLHATPSKPDHAPPIGLDGFTALARAARLPALAIGGVTVRDAAAIKAAGGAGLAVVSSISRAGDMEAAARALCHSWRDA